MDDRTWSSDAFFSSDSTRLVSWDPESASNTAEISVHSLSGARIAGIKPHRRLYGVVGLSAPGRLVFAGRGGVKCIDPTQGAAVPSWEHALVGEEYGISGLELVGDSLVAVRQSYGWWKLLDHSGSVRYTWNPQALSSSDPLYSWEEYAQYRPYGTPSVDWVVIYNETSRAFLLHVPTAQLSPLALQVAAPTGFARQNGVTGGQIIFHTSNSIRLRAVSLP